MTLAIILACRDCLARLDGRFSIVESHIKHASSLSGNAFAKNFFNSKLRLYSHSLLMAHCSFGFEVMHRPVTKYTANASADIDKAL